MSPELLERETQTPMSFMNEDIKTELDLPYAELVDESLWGRLTKRIEKDEGVDGEMAGRIMNEALVFLKSCAENPGVPLAPSEKVDAGWHTFILYTQDYAKFCDNIAGGFIHHEPSDKEGEIGTGMTISETVDFLQDNGFEIDTELWLTDTTQKGECGIRCVSVANECGRSCEGMLSNMVEVQAQCGPPVPPPQCNVPPTPPQPPTPPPPIIPQCSVR